MQQEKYKLSWNTYSDHLKEMMKEMLTSKYYADVTLISDDKKLLKAHRNILSACSPVLTLVPKKSVQYNAQFDAHEDLYCACARFCYSVSPWVTFQKF